MKNCRRLGWLLFVQSAMSLRRALPWGIVTHAGGCIAVVWGWNKWTWRRVGKLLDGSFEAYNAVLQAHPGCRACTNKRNLCSVTAQSAVVCEGYHAGFEDAFVNSVWLGVWDEVSSVLAHEAFGRSPNLVLCRCWKRPTHDPDHHRRASAYLFLPHMVDPRVQTRESNSVSFSDRWTGGVFFLQKRSHPGQELGLWYFLATWHSVLHR